MWPSSGNTGWVPCRARARFSSRGRLQLLERGVRQVGDLGVVAGEHHRVAGKAGRAPVVVEVVEVGEQDRGAARVDRRPRRLPGGLGVLDGREADRRARQLHELLLQPRHPAIGEPRRRLPVDRHVVEADAGAEPERHLLGDLDPVVSEQVAKRGRPAVVARPVSVAGDHPRCGASSPCPAFSRIDAAVSCPRCGRTRATRAPRPAHAARDAHPLPLARGRGRGREGRRDDGRMRGDLGGDRGGRRRSATPTGAGGLAARGRRGPDVDRAQLPVKLVGAPATRPDFGACRRSPAPRASSRFPSAHATSSLAAATAMTRVVPGAPVPLYAIAVALCALRVPIWACTTPPTCSAARCSGRRRPGGAARGRSP